MVFCSPGVNRLLAAACILLVLTFKTSAAVARAYGIAIALTMAITSIWFYSAASADLGWSFFRAAEVTGVFLLVDGAFLPANTLKIFLHGGWFALIMGGGMMTLMLVWVLGRWRLYTRLSREALPVEELLQELQKCHIHRASGIALPFR